MNEFRKTDVTIAIPTVGRNLDTLFVVLGALNLHAHDAKKIVVWDGGYPLDEKLINKIKSFNVSKVIIHERNKGLSAARNTALDSMDTSIGVFVDDDIEVENGFLDEIIAAHNEFKDEKYAFVGRVTWSNTNFDTELTRWYEKHGNWNVFTNSLDKSSLSNFMGGFTSFSVGFFKRIRFSEVFKKYGCEDVEFGVRFFSENGVLKYLKNTVGKHHKKLELDNYIKEHISAGYSKAILYELQPDSFFDKVFFDNSTSFDCYEYIDSIKRSIEILMCNKKFGFEYATLMSLITDACLKFGFYNYFEECAKSKNERLNLIRKVFELDSMKLDAESMLFLELVVSECPGFYLPYSILFNKEEAFNIYSIKNEFIPLSVRNRVSCCKESSPVEMYKETKKLDVGFKELYERYMKIIALSPDFVSAYIDISENKECPKETALAFCSIAEYFCSFRPAQEKNRHLEKIKIIRGML